MAYGESDLFHQSEDAHGPVEIHITQIGLDERTLMATNAIKAVLKSGHRLKIGFSGGKDSSVTVNLALNAAAELVLSGEVIQPIVVSHSDTGIESPVVRAIADAELHKIKFFAKKHGLDLKVHVAKPSLATGFAAKIIGGRALPSFPSKQQECTVDWKINSSIRLAKKLDKEARLNGGPLASGLVTLLGTREDESISRGIKTKGRCESASHIWENKDGEPFLSPVLHWTSDDIFEYLGYCAAGLLASYSDFQSVMEFYADAGGSSCSVVGDLTVAKNAKPCGARSGCYLCVASTDKSARTMIETNPGKYPYLTPLLRLRDFISFTECDWSRRNYIARTIDDKGFIRIAADQYSPAMCEELLRYSLHAQSEANRLKAPSHVSIVGIRELIAIDFFWSVRGLHKPFHALKIYLEHMDGMSVEAPLMTKAITRTAPPEIGKIYVGTDWDSDMAGELGASGLRDPIWEMFSDSCGPGLKASRAGKVLLDLDESFEFDVDEEGALMFLDFEAEEQIEQWHRDDVDWTAAASIYLRFGCVQLGKGMSSSVDKAIRRSQWRQRNQLHGQRGPNELWGLCASRNARQDALFEESMG